MINRNKIYLDYSATTPVKQEVLECMLPYFTEVYGNASSSAHAYGWDAAEAVDIARQQVANLIGAAPSEIIFTSGATEAINLSLRGLFAQLHSEKNHIITCQTEHKAVLETCNSLEKQGASVSYLEVDAKGNINLQALEALISENTLAICLMTINNETGVIHPIELMSEIANKHNIAFITDATQALGKIPFNVTTEGIDMAAFSAHKLYGPKGIGALYINKNSSVKLQPFLTGGDQEKHLRAGTLNVPGIVGFGKACELAQKNLKNDIEHTARLNKLLTSALLKIDGAFINGANNITPHIINIGFEDIEGTKLLRRLKQIAISQGSACNSNITEPSHVLTAMKVSKLQALSSVRISIGSLTSAEEIDIAIKDITQAVNALRKPLV